MSSLHRPYSDLSDSELDQLSGEAAHFRVRMSLSDPREVVAKLIEYGCPRKDAAGMVNHPMLRLGAFRFYFDCLDGDLGDEEARDRRDFVAESWRRMREGRRLEGRG